MKIPETFLPNKSLETEIEQLLKKPKKRNITTEKDLETDKARNEFPRLIEHLLGLYSKLRVIERNKHKDLDTEYQHKTWLFYDDDKFLGSINTYTRNIAKFLFEHGYTGSIVIGKEFYKLEYRKGHYYNDGTVIQTQDELRRDSSAEIPFP